MFIGGASRSRSVSTMTKNGDHDPKPGSGAEGEASADTPLPFIPRKDDQTPVGDTDQHSKAYQPSEAEERIKREGAKQG